MIWEDLKRELLRITSINKKMFIWFRDDDITCYSEKLEKLLNYFSKVSIPVLLGIIPENFSVSDTAKILSYDMVSVGQHGFSHIDYSLNPEIKSELCVCRGVENVIYEQKKGREFLNKHFNYVFKDVFIPPWFEMDEDIYMLLRQEKYSIFSSWWTNEITSDGIPEINAQVDFIDWDKGEFFSGEQCALDHLIRECTSLIESPALEISITGIVLHHELFCNESFIFLAKLIEFLLKFECISIISIDEAYRLMNTFNSKNMKESLA